MDIDWTLDTMAAINRARPQPMPDAVMQGMERHLRDHHMSPDQVGDMAAASDVGRVIVTHFVGKEDTASRATYVDEITTRFSGDAVIANDMDRF